MSLPVGGGFAASASNTVSLTTNPRAMPALRANAVAAMVRLGWAGVNVMSYNPYVVPQEGTV